MALVALYANKFEYQGSKVLIGGVGAMPRKGWQIHLLAKMPYCTWAQGGQLRWPFAGMLGFSYTFDVIKPKPAVSGQGAAENPGLDTGSRVRVE